MSAVRRRAAQALIPLLLGAVSLGAPLVNAGAGPPRALFLALAPDQPTPELRVTARKDATRGWLLEIEATHFRFTATCLPSAAAAPIGHAHVSEGGTKRATAFTPVVALGPLAPGRHDLKVTLRGQDHRALVGQSGLIAAEVTIIVPEPLPRAR